MTGGRLDRASWPRSRRTGDHHHTVADLSLELLPRSHATGHLQLVHRRLTSSRSGVHLSQTVHGRVRTSTLAASSTLPLTQPLTCFRATALRAS